MKMISPQFNCMLHLLLKAGLTFFSLDTFTNLF